MLPFEVLRNGVPCHVAKPTGYTLFYRLCFGLWFTLYTEKEGKMYEAKRVFHRFGIYIAGRGLALKGVGDFSGAARHGASRGILAGGALVKGRL